MLSAVSQNPFHYLWIMRCAGTNIRNNSECKIIPNCPTVNISPIIELLDESLFPSVFTNFRRFYGTVFTEIPYYLKEASNKFQEKAQIISRKYPDCSDFFLTNRRPIGIPVISSEHTGLIDYSRELHSLQLIRSNFEKIAVRTRVPTFDIAQTPSIETSFRTLVNSLTHEDYLFLDIFYLNGVLAQIKLNLDRLIGIARERTTHIYILNAFEPEDSAHNYGPFLSKYYDLPGFGDFATEKRYPATGGRSTTKIIRYYQWEKFLLREFSAGTYLAALQLMMSSNYWINHSAHNRSCPACNRLNLRTVNEGHPYWKQYRILHYLYSILNETQNTYVNTTSAEDFDPDGYDVIFNSTDA